MRLHRFIGDFDLDAKTLTITDAGLVSQWRTVLRLKPADTLILCDGRGREAEAVIVRLEAKVAEVAIENRDTPKREPQKAATLYCALLKRENFELVVQKATEIGIARIVPLLTERTIKTGFNVDRLQKIIKEAAEQSGRTTLPELSELASFKDAVKEVQGEDCILFDLGENPVHMPIQAHAAFIGPEGGFSESEVGLARERGFAISSLGDLTMRGETAAIVVSYLMIQ